MKAPLPVAAALLCLALDAPVWAGDTIGYMDAATLGIGGGVSTTLTPEFGLRADIHLLSLGHVGTTSGGLTYNGQLRVIPLELLVDYYPLIGSPWPSGLRVSGGVVVGSGKVTVTARPSNGGQLTINGKTYVALNPQTDTVTGDANFLSGVSPYIGVGYSANPAQNGGVSVKADLGVIFTHLSTSVTANGALAADPTVAANLQAEQQNLAHDLRTLKSYPVVSVGLGYAF